MIWWPTTKIYFIGEIIDMSRPRQTVYERWGVDGATILAQVKSLGNEAIGRAGDALIEHEIQCHLRESASENSKQVTGILQRGKTVSLLTLAQANFFGSLLREIA